MSNSTLRWNKSLFLTLLLGSIFTLSFVLYQSYHPHLNSTDDSINSDISRQTNNHPTSGNSVADLTSSESESAFRNTGSTSHQPVLDKSKRSEVSETYGKLPLSFEQNSGQTDGQVKFLSRGSGYNLFLTSNEAVFTLTKAPQSKAQNKSGSRLIPDREAKRATGASTFQKSTVVRMKLEGANPSPEVTGEDGQAGKSNYFIGNDQSKWRTDVSRYSKVKYRNVYDGIDLVYYGNQRQLEYDFIIAPHIDPSTINLSFNGVKGLRLDAEGNLILRASDGGEIQQHKPVVYQEIAGEKKEVKGK